MAYNIKYSDSSKPSITIADNTVDTTTDLKLIGPKYANGYGEIIATNFLNLLENFASPVEPTSPIAGQMWYDSQTNSLKFYTQNSEWKAVSTTRVSAAPIINNNITITGDERPGDILVDETQRKVFAFMDNEWVLIFQESDENTFAEVRTRYDSAGFSHITYEITVNRKTVMVLSSDETAWIPRSTGALPELVANGDLMISSFPVVEPGLNLYNRNPAQVNIRSEDPTLTPQQILNCEDPEPVTYSRGVYNPQSVLVYADGSVVIGSGEMITINDTIGATVFSWYENDLGRNPDKPGFDFWYDIYVNFGLTATRNAFEASDDYAQETTPEGSAVWKSYCEYLVEVSECVNPDPITYDKGEYNPQSVLVYANGTTRLGIGEIISTNDSTGETIYDWYVDDLGRNPDRTGFDFWYGIFLEFGETATRDAFVNSDDYQQELTSQGSASWQTYCEYLDTTGTLNNLTTGNFRTGDFWINSITNEMWIYQLTSWLKISDTRKDTRVVARLRKDDSGVSHRTLETIVDGKIISIDSSESTPYILNDDELDEVGDPLVDTFTNPIYLGSNPIPVDESSSASSSIQPNAYVPSGAVQAFAMQTPPTGWLECDGSAISRTTYSRLFDLIGVTYGVGDGTNTFNLPDLRGEFIRGWDNGRGIDGGRTFGSAQGSQLESHTHDTARVEVDDGDGGIDHWVMTQTGEPSTVDTFETDSTGGTETRPRNISLMYCIKT